jgi:predicted dehydrogenase
VKKSRIAIVGLGMAVVPHAKSVLDLPDRVEVAYAFSPSAARRAKFAERFPFPQCDRLETILKDGSVDAVAVLTPPNTHLDIVKRCAVAGKHVLLEKPLETNSARAEELVADCRGVTQAIHTLDVLLSLAGDPREVKSYAATMPVHRMECEDLVCAAVRWQSGALGVIEATTAAYPGAAERIELTGTLGTASLAGTALQLCRHDGSKEMIAADGFAGGAGADPMAFPHDYHRGVWRDFLDAIQNGGEPRVNGEEALRVHRLIDALLASAATGKPARFAAAGTETR